MNRNRIVVVGNGMGESARLRSEASRTRERRAMDGRAGLSDGREVAPWTAGPVLRFLEGRP
jgi:hypothetical protein